MGMTVEELLQLTAFLGDDHKLAPKLDELIKRTQAAEKAEAKLKAEQETHQATKSEVDLYVAQKMEELNNAQAKHDATANEVARRIDLNNAQLSRMGDLERQNEQRTAALDKMEAGLMTREKSLAIDKARVAHEHSAVMLRKQELEDRYERLRAAMG